MALPGLSFEIVRAQPTPGLRTDRTAVLALTERGPQEIPVLVESYDQFVESFGQPVDGMLAPLLARSYFDNGGQQLLVARFVPDEAKHATGALPLAEITVGPGETLKLRARDPGEFGNHISVTALVSVRKRGKGTRVANTSQLSVPVAAGAAAPFVAADVGRPVRLVGRFTGGTSEAWTRLVTAAAPVAGTQLLTFGDPLPAAATGATAEPVLIEVHEQTFTLLIEEPGRADLLVPGLDLTKPTDLRDRLAATTVELVSVPPLAAGAPELPLPDRPVTLAGGTLAFEDIPARAAGLRRSFERALAALELSDVPDVVVAPDLWNRIFRTKGIFTLSFDPADATALADAMVQSAARTSDRVVLLDPPLVEGDGGARPMTVSELEVWRRDRGNVLVENLRDFAAAYTPWARIVAGGVFRGDRTLLVPPSLFVAGRMAITARERGPWNATGNVSLENVVGLGGTLSVSDQERLQDVGINPLRMELPSGATIQGVRALAWPDRKPWRFLSTRRLFNFLRRSLRPIGLSYVFEPNSPRTWILLRRDVERLLSDLFAGGGLAGNGPQQAFFVKIDEELNPEDARGNGVLTAQIGVAPAVPLEFLVVRLVVQNGIAKVTEEPQKAS